MHIDKTELKEMWMLFSLQQAEQLKEQSDLLTKAQDALQEIASLAQDSHGIAGYHCNGEIEPWDNILRPVHQMIDAIISHGKKSPTVYFHAPDSAVLHLELDKAHLESGALQNQLMVQDDACRHAQARLMLLESSIAEAMQENPSQVFMLRELLDAAKERSATLPAAPLMTLDKAIETQQITSIAFRHTQQECLDLPAQKLTLKEMIDANNYIANLNELAELATEGGTSFPCYPQFDENAIVAAFQSMHAS